MPITIFISALQFWVDFRMLLSIFYMVHTDVSHKVKQAQVP